MRIQSILARKGGFVATIHPDASVFDASRRLSEHRIGALVVTADAEHIDGILSERDIALAIADHGERAVRMRVADLMSHDVRTCRPTDSIDGLMATMTEHRIRHVPVIDDGRLIGVLSIGDAVKARMDQLEFERDQLNNYVAGG